MAGFIFPTDDDRQNDYPQAYWSIAESHLMHRAERATIVVVPYKDRAAFEDGADPISERARTYDFRPEAQPERRNLATDEVIAPIPAYGALFSEAALAAGNPFVALYGFLLGRPEFAGAEFAK